ncbi:MAG TPA: ABC transporter substrate-binding protein [Verrucomicrobiae bacterium]|nr:ABC transporter substrate-binding protein [Verrucomicrobiae bacterium]
MASWSWLDRLRSAWRRVFFWQDIPSPGSSEEFHPHHAHDHALVLSVTSPRKVPGWKQLRFINRVLTPAERRVFWISILVFVIALGVGLFGLGRLNFEGVPASGGEYTEAVVGSPKLINPLFAPTNDVDRDLVALVFSGLFRLDQHLEAQPDLATSYRWLDDGKTLEVTLRDDARFHDGEPVTADDVVFTYHAIKNPQWLSPLAADFHDVDIIKVDDQTVQFHLSQPDALFPNLLTVGILPAHVWEDVPDTSARLADVNLKPIGSGPYQVESFTRDGRGNILSFQLSAFPAYYGLKPLIQGVRLRFYPDRTQALSALNNGQADALAFVPWADTGKGRTDHFQPYTLALPQETVAFFNTKDKLLKDEKLRHALSLAVDPDELASVASDHAQAVSSPFPFLNDASSTAPDLEQARKELDALGWKLGEGETVRHLGASTSTASSTLLTLTIDVPNQADLLAVADHLKRRWSLLGAQVDIHTDDPEPLLRNALENRGYQIILWNVLVPPDFDLSAFWSSANTTGHGLNLSNIADKDIDTALGLVQNASSTDAVQTAELKLSAAIRARSAALFLLRPTYAMLVDKRVMGISDMVISQPSDRLLQIANWYVDQALRWK